MPRLRLAASRAEAESADRIASATTSCAAATTPRSVMRATWPAPARSCCTPIGAARPRRPMRG
jgi:hypothetical protein